MIINTSDLLSSPLTILISLFSKVRLTFRQTWHEKRHAKVKSEANGFLKVKNENFFQTLLQLFAAFLQLLDNFLDPKGIFCGVYFLCSTHLVLYSTKICLPFLGMGVKVSPRAALLLSKIRKKMDYKT
jgi:hypothetical protein